MFVVSRYVGQLDGCKQRKRLASDFDLLSLSFSHFAQGLTRSGLGPLETSRPSLLGLVTR